jgi:hypothetical protein
LEDIGYLLWRISGCAHLIISQGAMSFNSLLSMSSHRF